MLLDTPRGKGTGRDVEGADAARFTEAASEVRRPEEASATRTMARPRAGNTKGRTSMNVYFAQLLLEFKCRLCLDVKGQSHHRQDDYVFGQGKAERVR